MPTTFENFETALRGHALEFGVDLPESAISSFLDYYELVMRWNPRLHLVAPCSPAEFAHRHVLESLLLLAHLPDGARLIDVGAGAGLPSIPCLIARKDLRAILFESSMKKSVFLRETMKRLGLSERMNVVAGRFQDFEAPEAGAITCRALENFEELLPELMSWAPAGSTFLFFVGEKLREALLSMLPASTVTLIPTSERRFLFVSLATDRDTRPVSSRKRNASDD